MGAGDGMTGTDVAAAEWADMLKQSRTPDGGLYLDAATIAVRLGCRIDEVGSLGIVATYRDADALTESNHRTAVAEMTERLTGVSATRWQVVRFSCSMSGWVDHVFLNLTDEDVRAYADDVTERIERYPALDECDYSDLEWGQNHPREGECYSDEGEDCPCHEWEGEPGNTANLTANATERNTQ